MGEYIPIQWTYIQVNFTTFSEKLALLEKYGSRYWELCSCETRIFDGYTQEAGHLVFKRDKRLINQQ